MKWMVMEIIDSKFFGFVNFGYLFWMLECLLICKLKLF